MQVRIGVFVVSALLFVSGVGFVVVAARVQRSAPQSSIEALQAVGTVRHIMRGIVDPAATTVFGAVSTTVTAAGVEEKVPRSDAEWNAVADSAAALAEAGNLLQVGSRLVDTGEWTAMSRRLVAAGSEALAAAEARDAARVFALGETIYETCDSCHARYQRAQ
jgi:hypothetical protein